MEFPIFLSRPCFDNVVELAYYSYLSSSQFSDITEVYHDAVLYTVSLIALEAYDYMCHSRAEYYICCICGICVGYSTHCVFPTVSFVCQTSTMVAAVPAISYYCAFMWRAIVSHCALC
jgi:hypothetical protein